MRWGLFWLSGLCAAGVMTIALKSGELRWLALAVAVVAGAYLGVLAWARLPAIPRSFNSWTSSGYSSRRFGPMAISVM